MPTLFPCSIVAGDKKVTIESNPTGAEVDVNGNITCTTPCTLTVSNAYFGFKHTAFSSRVDVPFAIRLLKEGYAPKDVVLTSGPHTWRSLNGQNSFDYYLMTSDHFELRLDPIRAFVPAGPAAGYEAKDPTPTGTVPPSEIAVQHALPAIVQVETSRGSGSGFFVTAQGLVVTNAHVVAGLQSATVITSSGQALQSNYIYVDQDRDLALIKVNVGSVAFLEISPTLPMQGADVIAIGTPGAKDANGSLMLPNTVTKGIVSGIRQFSADTVANLPGRAGYWIQTDAAINHGNSGGPLLDRSGKVVGINTLSFASTGTPGINFALASPELIQIAHQRLGLTLGSATMAPTSGDSASQLATKLQISSTPAGADIEVDGVFFGNTPSEITVSAGPRSVRISRRGFKPYERIIQAQPNGSQRISVDLEAVQ
jgi:serine protease Do